MEVLPELQDDPSALEHIFVKSPLTGQQVPLCTLVKWTTKPTTFLSINHQGQFPAVTLSFNLAPGVALGDAVNAIQQADRADRRAGFDRRQFQGNAQAFQSSLAVGTPPGRGRARRRSISSSACSMRATSTR